MPIDLKDCQIDHKAQKYQLMLENLQGNILKGHGRDFTIHFFVKFTAAPNIVKRWIRDFSPHVVSAKQQLQETQEYKALKIPGGLFCNLFLSSLGYEYILELTKEELKNLFPEPDEDGTGVNFLDGMEASQTQLNDPSPETWEAGYRGRQIHAMILLADDDQNYLLRRARQVLFQIRTVGEVLAVERGRSLKNKQKQGIEHFGYADGVSQPLFLNSDIKQEEEKIGIDKWNPSAPLDLALMKDPKAKVEDCFGSYFVFRKLEQNVRGFKQREEELAKALGLEGEDEERAGALVVGRFEDGTPIVLQKDAPSNPAVPPLNNFKYDLDDPSGVKCPFHAHIRKTNPRGDVTNKFGVDEEQAERSRRIVRRGITYGIRKDDPNDGDVPPEQRPSEDVGLLFMCFQSSIPRQFGFMQKSWANNVDFVNEKTGRDPVIGQKGDGDSQPQEWIAVWGEPQTKPFDFGEFVTLKGGEFFFAPSIPFLKNL